jgi:hypothetical protein
VQAGGEVEQHLLEPALDRRGQGRVRVVPVVPALREGRRIARPLDGLDAEAAVLDADEAPEVAEVVRLAVGGEGHDLVLVRAAAKAEVRGQLLVEQSERMRELLRSEHLEVTVSIAAVQVPGPLAAPVDHHHARLLPTGRQARGGGVRDVMGHEADAFGIDAERRAQEERRALDEERSQRLPAVGRDVPVHGRRERWIVGICDRVEVSGLESRALEAPGRRLLRQLPGREGNGNLAVLAAAEALLLGRGHDPAADDDGGGRIVKNRVDSQDVHWEATSRFYAALNQRRRSGENRLVYLLLGVTHFQKK